MKPFVLIPALLLVPLAASADVVLSEIDLANNKLELVNTGGAAVDLTGWWWCNRVNGSPFYSLVTSSSTVDAGLSSPGATLTNIGAGQVLVIDITAAFLPDANGELGLYTVNSFGSSAAIHDYVLWGGNGVRDMTAQNAGIWTDNDAISVAGLGAGDTIQLKAGAPGNAAADYVIAPSTLGAEQVLPPMVVLSELDLASNKVELVNTGGSAVDLTGWWWCNRVNGSPFYSLVTSSSTVDAGLSSPGATLTNIGAGQVLVIDITAAFLPDANGELGLYTVNSFGSSAAIHDYVLWGGNGVRDMTAQNAGIWTDNDAISVAGLGAGDTIQLRAGAPGDLAAEYTVGAANLGVAQSLAPAEVGIGESGFLDADTFFIEFTYNGLGTVKVTESATLDPPFTDVAARTTVATPSPTRFEFDIVGTALFFRVEEE